MSDRLLTDVWDADACGLIQSTGCRRRLAALHVGPGGDLDGHSGRPEKDTVREPAGHIARTPSYVPYESKEVPRYATGDRIGRQALNATFSREVLASAMASPPAATALVAAATIRAQLLSGPAGQTLEALAAVAPKKGGEVDRMLVEYCARHADRPEQAAPMAIRDFYGSWYAWSFPRCTDGRIPDLVGSALCLTTAVDYVGPADAAGGGGRDAHLAAASEGLACLAGTASTQVLRDIVVATALMKTKDTLVTASAAITDPRGFVHAAGGPVTPEELFRARWWDADLTPVFRAILSTPDYRHLTDDLGTFRAADRCSRIKRAITTAYRYNEIVDLVWDCRHGEWLSEMCVALAMGGGGAVMGIGDACARITDDVLTCDCHENGHEEAAEIAMGSCLFFLVAPRYIVPQQLAAYSTAPDPVSSAYAWRPAGTRLRGVAHTALQPGDMLHSPTWQPLWTGTSDLNGREAPWAAQLARRAVIRCLADPKSQDAVRACEAAATSVLADCDRLNTPASLHELAEPWCRLFDTVLDAVVANSTAHHQATTELRPLIGRIWQQRIIGVDNQSTGAADPVHEQLYADVDHAIRRTYSLPPAEGFAVRRAFLGVVTSAAELSGLNPYARLADGPARLLLDATETSHPFLPPA
ncbi:hypothetical protein [Streptomyces pathocidini]|nr:hypothetical protein [Streptomyces pathocidini]